MLSFPDKGVLHNMLSFPVKKVLHCMLSFHDKEVLHSILSFHDKRCFSIIVYFPFLTKGFSIVCFLSWQGSCLLHAFLTCKAVVRCMLSFYDKAIGHNNIMLSVYDEEVGVHRMFSSHNKVELRTALSSHSKAEMPTQRLWVWLLTILGEYFSIVLFGLWSLRGWSTTVWFGFSVLFIFKLYVWILYYSFPQLL